MIGKLIGRLFGLVMLAGVLGILALGGYFLYKSGQPMQVEEAQRRVPGITFREFWKDRWGQWDKWNDKLTAIGKGRPCGAFARDFFVPTLVLSTGDLIYIRTHQGTKALDAFIKKNNGIVPPDDLIYGSLLKFPDALWWYFENVYWYRFAKDGGFPVKELNQQRACSTTYPTLANSGN